MRTRSFKLFNIIILMVFHLFIFGLMSLAFAADPPPEEEGGEIVQTEEQNEPEDDLEEPVFKNPTQAQRAINLAEAYAAKPDPELEEALDALEKAENDLLSAKEDGDKEAIEKAEEALENAQEAADSYMAENAGITPEEIGEMREEGMGWGEIAHELGLHPGVLGMRHTKTYKNKKGWEEDISPDGEVSDFEIEEATARNFKSGFSKGHGASVDNKGNKNDKGKSSGKGEKGKTNSGNKGGSKGNNGGKKK
ncbi:MAG: hypothetical protein K8S13_22025 [Desulfobacula sp.]|uniref:hypothetical protein n=1 Tax=Desulfobacula sp. TaxID=2593537 RepID=UPI0025C5704C|nr:hypothetical protein [Desulfobacula sp.]MCD4722508.1 hypothetical protein [Desulfobacula sp.]